MHQLAMLGPGHQGGVSGSTGIRRTDRPAGLTGPHVISVTQATRLPYGRPRPAHHSSGGFYEGGDPLDVAAQGRDSGG